MGTALRAPSPDPWWHDAGDGITVAPFGLNELLDDVGGPIVLLDPAGDPIEEADLPADGVYCVSDHVPLKETEQALLTRRASVQVSLGDAWYHGNHVVSVVQHRLDRLHGASRPRGSP